MHGIKFNIQFCPLLSLYIYMYMYVHLSIGKYSHSFGPFLIWLVLCGFILSAFSAASDTRPAWRGWTHRWIRPPWTSQTSQQLIAVTDKRRMAIVMIHQWSWGLQITCSSVFLGIPSIGLKTREFTVFRWLVSACFSYL